jgi:hypothetical protein
MKKLLLFSLLVVMASCKTDAEKKPAEENSNLNVTAPNTAPLIATWELVAQKLDGIAQPFQDNSEITFGENNTYKGFNNKTFSYEFKKDTLLLYPAGSSSPEKTHFTYLNETKNEIQLTTKLADGRVVQTQLRRKAG